MGAKGFYKKTRNQKMAPALRGHDRWTGITNIASGDSSVVVSATQISSGNVIMTGLGITSVATHQTLDTSVNSVVTGTSMVLQVHRATVDTQQVWYTIIDKV